MMIYLLRTQLGRFKLLALAEGVSFLAILFVTMPLKYLMDIPGPNKGVGLVHGLLFVWYILAVIQVKAECRWTLGKMLLAMLAAIIPFGTFYVTARMLPKDSDHKKEQ